MLALRLALIRSGIPERYAMADPHYEPAMRNYINTMLRAYDVPNYYDYSQTTEGQDYPRMFDPTPQEHITMQDLLEHGHPDSLMALIDQFTDRGIPHELDTTRSIGYQLIGGSIPADEYAQYTHPGQSLWGGILPHGALRHIAAGLHDPVNYAAFHPHNFGTALTANNFLHNMLNVETNQPPWVDWAGFHHAPQGAPQSLISRLQGRQGQGYGPYEAAIDQLVRHPSIPRLLNVHDVAHRLYQTGGNHQLLWPREDVSHTLLTRIIPRLRASVLPGTAHLPGVGS